MNVASTTTAISVFVTVIAVGYTCKFNICKYFVCWSERIVSFLCGYAGYVRIFLTHAKFAAHGVEI
jgi:hypothetical protein